VLVADALPEALAGARREAASAFGDDRLILERFIVDPRHIEVQVVGDTHGAVVHLGERECSIQRRHQKIVEESPSSALDERTRERLCAAGVAAARAAAYVGAGTVEFVLGAGGFHFIEMNTRLQVEHGVTEMVTGVDLVEWQLRVAAGEPLPASQDLIVSRGHAIEARVYAEDPAREFLPQTGRVLAFAVPTEPGVRVDAGIDAASTVSPHYDPMVAKLIAHGPDRGAALATLARALSDTVLLGVTSNVEFLRAVIGHADVVSGRYTTGFVADRLGDWAPAPSPPELIASAAAAVAAPSSDDGPWSRLGPWRAGGGGWSVELDDRGTTHHAVVRIGDGTAVVDVDGTPTRTDPDATVARAGGAVWVHSRGLTRRIGVVAPTRHVDPALVAASGTLRAPMPGTVAAVLVDEGALVEPGQTLVVVEAMKMEHPVRATVAGTVTGLSVRPGDVVAADQALVEVVPVAAP